jgi:hypothetical protein
MMPEIVNLKGAAERSGLHIEIARGTSVSLATFEMRSAWYIEISEKRWTEKGRPAKPRLLMRVIASDGQGPLELIEMLKIAYEQGDVKIERPSSPVS